MSPYQVAQLEAILCIMAQMKSLTAHCMLTLVSEGVTSVTACMLREIEFDAFTPTNDTSLVIAVLPGDSELEDAAPTYCLSSNALG